MALSSFAQKLLSGQNITFREIAREIDRLEDHQTDDPLSRLTFRERSVFDLFDMTNKEIGRRLRISPGTVKTHVAGILRKLNVHSRCAAVMKVFRHHEG